MFSHVASVNFINIKNKTTVIDPSEVIEIKIINSCSFEGSSDQLLGEQHRYLTGDDPLTLNPV